MSTPAAKRPRLGTPAADPPTTPSVLLFVPPVGVPHSGSVLKAWQAHVPALGGSIIQDAQEAASLAAITHCVVPQPGGGWPSIPSSLHPGSTRVPPGLHYVTQQWVADCMRSQRWLPEDKYQPSSAELQQQQQPSPSKSGQDGHSSSTTAALAAWLGPSLWPPEHAEMDNTELLLQVRCRQCLDQRRVDAMLLLAAQVPRALPPSAPHAPASRHLPVIHPSIAHKLCLACAWLTHCALPPTLPRSHLPHTHSPAPPLHQGDFDEERCRSVGNEQVRTVGVSHFSRFVASLEHSL